MSLVLPTLPKDTTYQPRQISAARNLLPTFGGPGQRLARKGSRWGIEVSIPAVSGKSCGPALLADLFQETETVVLKFPEPGMPTQNYGAPKVDGSGQAGRFLSLKDLTPGIQIRKGKFFSTLNVGQYFLYNVSEAAVVGGDGRVTLKIWPMLRRPPTANDAVQFDQPLIEGFVQTPQEWQTGRMTGIPINFMVSERE